MVSDGLISFTGHWPGYLAYIQHRRVYPHLNGYNLGSSEDQAEHRLVIDRREQTAYILPCRQAERLLSSQWEQAGRPSIPQVFSLEELEEVVRRTAEQWQPPSDQDLRALMEADHAAVQALRDWLDRFGGDETSQEDQR